MGSGASDPTADVRPDPDPAAEADATVRADPHPDPGPDAEVDPIVAHLAKFPGPQRRALERTRMTISAALPGAIPTISYGMPTFKVDGPKGIAVVGFDGFKAHNSLFPYSGAVVALIAAELPDWRTSKGTIRFPPDLAFPAPLLRLVLAARIDEINATLHDRAGRSRAFYSNGRLKHAGGMRDHCMNGKWKWFRRDGSLMREGSFRLGVQTGTWTTYARDGRVVRTTEV